MLLLFFSACINLWGIVQGLTQGVGKWKGKANPIWTQVGGMMNGLIMSGREVIYVDEGA